MNPPDVTSKDRFLSSRQRYQRIVNKASCLSLVSNAILYWKIRSRSPRPWAVSGHKARTSPMKSYRTSLCCRSGMSYRTARTLSRIAKLGKKAVARSNCAQNRNILFKCPRWSKLIAGAGAGVSSPATGFASGAVGVRNTFVHVRGDRARRLPPSPNPKISSQPALTIHSNGGNNVGRARKQ